MPKPNIQRVAFRYLEKQAADNPPEYYQSIEKNLYRAQGAGNNGVDLSPKDKIKAKRDLAVAFPVGTGRDNSGYVTKGTVLQLDSQGTSRGDNFAKVVSGNAYSWKYEGYGSEPIGVYSKERVALSYRGGWSMGYAPYSLGSIDPKLWEIL